ncbi:MULTISPECIES: nuclear transport factor 2 family protein [unclassified Mycobacterium]|uniref:nuclear transport factor 2 family protein n=1 Tax=unclassified Mycobacterium TaxID=2642494 RepID=UPI0029C70D2A|nr:MULTISPECIES: nuclear transport factor 2 family protein [unclassified Mycobacterium]
MTEAVRQTHDQLADEMEIRGVVHRYADASSRRDPAGVASTLTSDGEWHSPAMGNHQGRDAVASFFTTMLEDWNAFIQGLLSGVVVLDAADPDHATGRWFVEETGQRSGGANLTVSGVYHDEYVREAGTWLISHRRYDPLLIRADDTVTALPFPTDGPGLDSPLAGRAT